MMQKDLKFIKSLHLKKNRITHSLFLSEGEKIVNDLLQSKIELYRLIIMQNSHFITRDILKKFSDKIIYASKIQMKQISTLKEPSEVLAIFKIPLYKDLQIKNELILALDEVRDPGNLGTIIRTADWFGIQKIICSENTVEIYNPKVVQATMGSISRVRVYYVNLETFLSKQNLPIFGTFLKGENIYKKSLPNKGIIVMGNEANGIRSEVKKSIQHKISIPNFGKDGVIESLNVGIASAVILSEFKRS